MKILLFPRRERDFDKITVFEKNTEKVASGDPFWEEKWPKIDPGATRNREKVQKSKNLGGKFEEEKKVEKKRVKGIASAGDAEAGKEGFGKDMEGKWVGNGQWSSTPSLILRMGGRIVDASRIPPRL